MDGLSRAYNSTNLDPSLRAPLTFASYLARFRGASVASWRPSDHTIPTWSRHSRQLPCVRIWVGFEAALVPKAETADSEGLKPHNLVEAKHRPDWPLWEQAIHWHDVFNTLHAAGALTLEHALRGANEMALRKLTVQMN